VFDDPGNSGNGLIKGFVLPDADHRPASRSQDRVGPPVAFDVAPQLGGPIPVVRGRLAAMLGAHVPEAAVDKDGDLSCSEDYVGPDLRAIVKPKHVIFAVPVALPVQCAAQCDLWLGIRPAVRTHVTRTPFVERRRIDALAMSGCAVGATVLARHGHPVCRTDT
jgi:hypothetical protein